MSVRVPLATTAGAVFSAMYVLACGGSAETPIPGLGSTPAAPATQSPAAPIYIVSGTVSEVPSDAYGPTSVDGVLYASSDATRTTPLGGALVVVGPVPIDGATPPSMVPLGDAVTTTSTSGAFSLTVPQAPTGVSPSMPFVVPADNLSGYVPPVAGYYLEVFGQGTDGTSAGKPVPLHRFVALGSSLTLRVTSPTAAEAIALADLNSDREADANAPPLTFDESAEEVARLHASDEAGQNYYCHYDAKNAGPASRYLASLGLGVTGESLAMPGTGVTSASDAFAVAEQQFLSEKSNVPPGGHYVDLTDVTHRWAGLAAVPAPSDGTFYDVDYELVTPDGVSSQAPTGYAVTTALVGCPPGTVVNESARSRQNGRRF